MKRRFIVVSAIDPLKIGGATIDVTLSIDWGPIAIIEQPSDHLGPVTQLRIDGTYYNVRATPEQLITIIQKACERV